MFSSFTKTLKELSYKLLQIVQSLISKETLYDAAVAFLPQDVILFQIITRVPTKSVVRFMCVSKQWKSFLTSDRFREMHNDHIDHLEDRKLFFHSDETFYTIDCESLTDNAPCSRPLPQYPAPRPHCVHILTSFHGLVCLGLSKNCLGEDYVIILWNPVTTEYKRLSEPSNPDHMECYRNSRSVYGLYYCSGDDDYKLLVLTCSGNAYIYSLKSDSWRKLDTKPPIQRTKYLGWSCRPGFCLNKNLYFLSYAVRFDTKANSFHKIETPPDDDDDPPELLLSSSAITVHEGCIHLCVMYKSTTTTTACIKLWKFIADGDIWRMVATYQHRPKRSIYSCLVHLLNNGNMLMKEYKDGGVSLCQVDLRKQKYTAEYEFRVGSPAKVIYTETFVSPNRYMK